MIERELEAWWRPRQFSSEEVRHLLFGGNVSNKQVERIEISLGAPSVEGRGISYVNQSRVTRAWEHQDRGPLHLHALVWRCSPCGDDDGGERV